MTHREYKITLHRSNYEMGTNKSYSGMISILSFLIKGVVLEFLLVRNRLCKGASECFTPNMELFGLYSDLIGCQYEYRTPREKKLRKKRRRKSHVIADMWFIYAY